ncbi:MAG: hypothetical protein V1817_03690, partial [Candidatus Micrarchaeota archaeon]
MSKPRSPLLFSIAIVCTVCVAVFASFASAALPLENCADVLRVSFNQQKIVLSDKFDTGSPSTVTISGKPGARFLFQEGVNGSSAFDVVVNEERHYLNPGDVLFLPYGENKWYSKYVGGIVSYSCAEEGGGKTDEFTLSVEKNCSFQLVDGSGFVADCLIVRTKRADAFRLRDDYLTNEFYVVAQHFKSGSAAQGGSVFYESPEQAGKFETFYVYASGKQYAGIPFVSCCAAPLATTAPTVKPSPSAEPSETEQPSPSTAPTAAPTSRPSTQPTATPTPMPEPNGGSAQSNDAGTALVVIVFFAAVAVAVFFLLKGKPAG